MTRVLYVGLIDYAYSIALFSSLVLNSWDERERERDEISTVACESLWLLQIRLLQIRDLHGTNK